MANKRIVVNGTFDILHVGHIQLLNFAKGLGGTLMVCIDTDRRVRELKGPSRPINSQEERKCILENLKAVDAVSFFDTDEELEFIFKQYSPDIMVKGSDYQGKPYVGQQYCKETIYYERIEPFSTTQKIQDIITR